MCHSEIGRTALQTEEASSAKDWRRIHGLWMESNVRQIHAETHKRGLKQCIQHAQAPGSQAMAPREGSGQPKCKRNANTAAAGFILGEEWARMSLGIRPQFKCQLSP